MATKQFDPFKSGGGRGIEWTDLTVNPLGGCKHACRWRMPDGTIAVCYAETLANSGLAKAGYPQGFEHAYWRGEKGLKDLKAGGVPMLIFPDSMSDLFGAWQDEAQVTAVLAAMAEAGHHTYQSLTKAPKRLLKWIDRFPPNLWVGVSSAPDFFLGRELSRDQQERYMHSALQALAAVRARGHVVWMSVEPLSWDVADILAAYPGVLDWAIIGAASNGRRYFQPDARHVDRLLDVLDAQGVAVFYKGNLKPTFETWAFPTPAKNRWREDFPVRSVPGSPFQGPAPAVVRRQRLARQYGWTLNTFLPAEPPATPPSRPPAVPVQPALF